MLIKRALSKEAQIFMAQFSVQDELTDQEMYRQQEVLDLSRSVLGNDRLSVVVGSRRFGLATKFSDGDLQVCDPRDMRVNSFTIKDCMQDVNLRNMGVDIQTYVSGWQLSEHPIAFSVGILVSDPELVSDADLQEGICSNVVGTVRRNVAAYQNERFYYPGIMASLCNHYYMPTWAHWADGYSKFPDKEPGNTRVDRVNRRWGHVDDRVSFPDFDGFMDIMEEVWDL